MLAIKVLAYVLPILAAVVSVAIGAYQVRLLRKETGDRSALTSLLSGDIFQRRGHREA